MKLIPITALALSLATFAQAGAVLTIDAPPATVASGDSFDLTVSVTPGTSDLINAFSIDLIYSNFLTVGPSSTPTEHGYFLTNGVYFFGGSVGSVSTGGLSGLFGISDALAAGDYLPAADELFDIQFTASSAGTPVVTVGPGSFLSGPDGSSIDITNVVVNSAPEPSGWLTCASGWAVVTALLRRRRRL